MPPFEIGHLALGRAPRVVGTITRRETLQAVGKDARFCCDAVEVRLDMIGTDVPGWLDSARHLEEAGYPVILTVRLSAEGGSWTQDDALRATHYQQAIAGLAAIDVEFSSALHGDLCKRASELGKPVIVSFHDFERTPPLEELQRTLQGIMEHPNAIPKIATMVTCNKDIETLRLLLSWNTGRPICILGMGSRGRGTRTSFPALGSCLTYGFVDASSAPGQFTAAELVEQLQDSMPAYRTDRSARSASPEA
jgi:3-dehydroquinate dehydratase I